MICTVLFIFTLCRKTITIFMLTLRIITQSICTLQVEFIETGICHGFVLWIDWVMDAESFTVLATGPGMP